MASRFRSADTTPVSSILIWRRPFGPAKRGSFKIKNSRDTEVSREFLQDEILLLKLVKHLRLWPGGDSLERIVPKTAALIVGRDNPLFLTDHLVITDFAGVGAVSTAALDFFSKKHTNSMPPQPLCAVNFSLLYAISSVFSRGFFQKPRKNCRT